MQEDYTLLIVGTAIAFTGLAALLLVPVYRFLKREDRANQSWTRDAVSARGIDLPPGPGETDVRRQMGGAAGEPPRSTDGGSDTSVGPAA